MKGEYVHIALIFLTNVYKLGSKFDVLEEGLNCIYCCENVFDMYVLTIY